MPVKLAPAGRHRYAPHRSPAWSTSSRARLLPRFGGPAAVSTRVGRAAPRAHVNASPHSLSLKRAYERRAPGDGIRVLVDRLWPRGVRKEQLALDLWLKDLAPSDALRRWYAHVPSRWPSFAERYRLELAQQGDLLQLLAELRQRGPVTLLYAARDTARNHAVVLRAVLEERRTGRLTTETRICT